MSMDTNLQTNLFTEQMYTEEEKLMNMRVKDEKKKGGKKAFQLQKPLKLKKKRYSED